MKTTLCIVDVQPRFPAAEYILEPVIDQIDLAHRRQDGIVVLEYGANDPKRGFGNFSYEPIYEALLKVPTDSWAIVKKFTDSGAEELIETMRIHKFAFDRVRLCGVNACACVKVTALNLKRSGRYKRVELSSQAISCTCSNSCGRCLASVRDDLKKIKRPYRPFE